MRRLLVTAFCALAFAGTAHAAGVPVYIVDQSKVLPTSQIENALPAFQAAVTYDFAPYWSTDAQLIVTDTPPKGGWWISVEDYTDSFGALGYHDVTNKTPWARVFVATTLGYGCSWQGVLTHELFEMLADPFIDRMAQGWRNWLVEVSDPVEDEAYNYSRTGRDGSLVPISDFVTPAWYKRIAKHGPFDFRHHVRRKGQVLPGGYAVYWKHDDWRFVFAEKR